MIVAVYGSLKRGFGNYRVMEDAQGVFIGEAESEADNFIMAGYGFPYVVTSDSEVAGKIMVELFEVPELGVLTNLDLLEGHPTFYKREVMRFTKANSKTIEAWVYIYQGNIIADVNLRQENGVYKWKE